MSHNFEDDLSGFAETLEQVLVDLIGQTDTDRVRAAMAHAVLGGGKRVRPYLVARTAALFGIDQADTLRVGAALELLHAYSLVHDDLPAMDDDDLRRGKPTVHIAFDEATAILAGDGLQTLAFEVLVDPETHEDPAVRADLCLGLARASGVDGMVGGQMRDIMAETAALDLDGTLVMQAMKTGALFRFACDAGAILGGADNTARDALRRYAGAIGTAFQIADDLLDRKSDAATLGKAAGKDRDRGKATLVDLLGDEAAHSRLDGLVANAEDAVSGFRNATHLKALARFIRNRER
ncbi:MAG: polyprenyl synthetase family protein [Pseudomonadota bacterium]